MRNAHALVVLDAELTNVGRAPCAHDWICQLDLRQGRSFIRATASSCRRRSLPSFSHGSLAAIGKEVLRFDPYLRRRRRPTAASRIIKQEEPFRCIRRGEPFGTKSSVERVVVKLEGKHWMYKASKKLLDASRCAPTAAHRSWPRTASIRLVRHPRAAHHRRLSPGAGTRDLSRRKRRAYFVTLSIKSTKALRSSAEPIFCSGILVPGV